MAAEFQTSFIPKQEAGPRRSAAPAATGIFYFVALIVFLVSVALAGGVFVYKQFVIQDIRSKESQIKKVGEQFDKKLIDEATRLSGRIAATKDLLDKHIAVSELFSFLEQNTLRAVSLQTFRYDQAVDNTITIDATGITPNYASIVLQSDQFGRTSIVRNLIFSGMNVNESGFVSFSLTANIDPQAMLYSESLSAAPAGDDGEIQEVGTPSN